MQLSLRTRLLAAGLTGLIHPLCFPNFDWGWLAWVVLIPLHWCIDGLSPSRAFRYGWLAGIIAFAGTVTWVITAMNQYGQVPYFLSAGLMLLLATYLGLYIAAYAWGVSILQSRSPSLLWIAAPSTWVMLEYLRTYSFSGLPWALLGYSQYRQLPLIQFADLTGVYGISFLLVMGNIIITHLLKWRTFPAAEGSPTRLWLPVTGFSALLILALAYGFWQIDRQQELDSAGQSLLVGVVQANIEQGKKWDKAYLDETMARYTNLSRHTAKGSQEIDLLIWPEAATPFLFEQEPSYHRQIQRIIETTASPLLFGSPTLRFHQDGRPYLYNSAFLLNRDGGIAGRYDKQHLVPFGEYIPLKSVLFFLDKLVVGIGDFQSGQGPLTMALPSPPAAISPRFGVPICFEVIFPDLVRRMANDGANFLITITNDAWFGDSAAPYQHFGMVVFRAVENHLAIARAANTGISGFIGPDGSIQTATPIFTEQALTGRIALRQEKTFYARNGDIFSWICVILSSLLMIYLRFKASVTLSRSQPQ